MRTTNKDEANFNVSDKFKKRALELIDESQAIQFAEGLRLNRAASVVFGREANRLEKKYGKEDPRTLEMAARLEASETAKSDLFARYVDAMTPPTTANEGWAVDGFVRTADGVPVGELTIAVCDKDGKPLKGFPSATSDPRGFFALTLEKLPDDPPSEVFLFALKGRKPLPSKEVRLVPAKGGSERVEIILLTRGTETPDPKGPDTPPDKGPDKPIDPKGTDKPPDKGPDKPPDKGTTSSGTRIPTTGTTTPDKTPVILVTAADKPPLTTTAKLPVEIKRSTKKKATTTKRRTTKASTKKSTGGTKKKTSKRSR